MSNQIVPVVLFAYARPKHLARVLQSLRENSVPLIVAYADGAKGGGDADAVRQVRSLLRSVDWADTKLIERNKNLGLGRSVLAGVTEVASSYDAFIVWEDDLISVPGTYAWLCAALERYANDARVMSVTGWTHPRVTPMGVGERPYFDGRAECWVWGSWSRAWKGMTSESAISKMRAARSRGNWDAKYGGDMPAMAYDESRKNIWAVRWLYHHLESGGICLRPPWSLVQHIGFDSTASNAENATQWAGYGLYRSPPAISEWPEVEENMQCEELWQKATCASGLAGLKRRLKLFSFCLWNDISSCFSRRL